MDTSVTEDQKIASWYLNKIQSSNDRGIEFTLSLMSVMNISKAKKCYFTGLPLNDKTRTIDRVDNSKGYVKGNVVACHKTFNNFKSVLEDKSNPLTLDNAIKGLTLAKKRLEE